MRDPARRERDVGAELVPAAESAGVAGRVFLRLDSAELDARRAFGGFSRKSALLEVVRPMRDVAAELVVHVALDRAPADELAQRRSRAIDRSEDSGDHSDSGVARSAAVIAATICSQLERSSRSCLRPAAVSE